MKNTDRMSWKDGWHVFGDMGYYVENGKLMRGMMDGRTVYPYLPVSKRYGGGGGMMPVGLLLAAETLTV